MAYDYVQRYVQPKDVVLDVCCGLLHPTRGLNCKALIGLDVWDKPSFVEEAKKHCHLLLSMNFLKYAWIFSDKSVDVVFCLDGIEHMEKEEGVLTLIEFERIARRKVVITTPVDWSDNRVNVEDANCWAFGNEYDTHRSHWTKEEFEKKGYDVTLFQEGKKILAVKKLGVG